jgi:glutamate-ammonia-ligase adenylyltransferase
VEAAAAARTAVADAVIGALLELAMAGHAARYGRIRGGAMAVVALGKAGSAEMMAGSDLDLMLIYDHPAGAAESDGPRPMAASQYFARAAQGFISALTVQTRHGPLYPVDMRLRPSGSKGPVAVSLAAFRQYHRDSAWTWERLALTRARVVAGPPGLRRRAAAAIREALRRGGDKPVRADTAAMRARLLRDLPPAGPWDVKLRPGGLMEVEFIVQALQVLHARQKDILVPGTQEAIARLRAAGLLAAPDAETLAGADRFWRQIQGLLRIALGRRIPASLPPPVLEKICRLAPDAADETALRAILDSRAAGVREIFTRLIGESASP